MRPPPASPFRPSVPKGGEIGTPALVDQCLFCRRPTDDYNPNVCERCHTSLIAGGISLVAAVRALRWDGGAAEEPPS